ncbi:MAG: hypothetical protein R2751_11020 [Bacteroidales bacterium]
MKRTASMARRARVPATAASPVVTSHSVLPRFIWAFTELMWGRAKPSKAVVRRRSMGKEDPNPAADPRGFWFSTPPMPFKKTRSSARASP